MIHCLLEAAILELEKPESGSSPGLPHFYVQHPEQGGKLSRYIRVEIT